MIAKCKGVNIGKFRIPPFELHKGELIGLYIHNNQESCDLKNEIIAIFTKQKNSNELDVYQKLEFVEHFKESKLRSLFYPTTVKQYLKSQEKPNTDALNKIYEVVNYIKPNSKVNTLAGNPRKWLSLFATLSKSKHIIFDLAGQDSLGAEKTLDLVNEYVQKGGSAILLDNFNKSESKCTEFIRLEINE